jgi:hypothetical protein
MGHYAAPVCGQAVSCFNRLVDSDKTGRRAKRRIKFMSSGYEPAPD